MTLAKTGLKPAASFAKNTALAFSVLLICFFMIITPESSSRGAAQGIGYCLNILIPSLFPFMFMASFVIKLGLLKKAQKIFSPVTKFLFYLPGCTASVIFLSLAAGYPVGARGVKSLLENREINREQATRMMCFCVNAGPAFIVGAVGNVLLKNPFMGMLMFTVQIITSLSAGILCAVKARFGKRKFYFKEEKPDHVNVKISEAVITSCKDASLSAFGICAPVIVFSAFISMLQDFNILNYASNMLVRFGFPESVPSALLTSMIEIISGCAQAARMHTNPSVISFALAFGGVCVHLQIAAILGHAGFDYRKFCISRFFSALAAGALTYIGINIFEKSVPVFSTLDRPVFVPSSSTAHGSAALIALCLYFVCTVNVKKLPSRNKKQKG